MPPEQTCRLPAVIYQLCHGLSTIALRLGHRLLATAFRYVIEGVAELTDAVRTSLLQSFSLCCDESILGQKLFAMFF